MLVGRARVQGAQGAGQTYRFAGMQIRHTGVQVRHALVLQTRIGGRTLWLACRWRRKVAVKAGPAPRPRMTSTPVEASLKAPYTGDRDSASSRLSSRAVEL